MGGSDKKQTKSTYTPPAWVEDASKKAIGIGNRIADQQYKPYTGRRVEGLSDNEREGMQRAGTSSSFAQGDWENATKYLKRGTEQFKDADISDYMNPYIKQALDPAAREIRESGALERNRIEGMASSMDAFSGSRSALAQGQNREKTLQSVSDLYGEGYARAYDSAVSIWGDERTRDLEAAGRFQMLGQQRFDASEQDISTLMATGATDRGIKQSLLDFNYEQFIEERDWDFRSLAGLLAAIQGTKGSYSTKEVTTSKKKKDNTADIVGAVVQIVAAVYSDERLKDNLTYIGSFMGIKLYTWTWNAIAQKMGITGPTVGVIAQQHPDFTVVSPSGYLMVDYNSLFGGQS